MSSFKNKKVCELKKLCEDKHIPFQKGANKSELIGLLESSASEIDVSNTIIPTESHDTDIFVSSLIASIEEKDCIEGMKKLVDNCADVVICDPPYNIGKDFGNDSDKQEMTSYIEWCDKWIQECLRILKPEGTLYIYGFPEILAFIRVQIGLSRHVRWLTWHYTNKVVPSLNYWQRTQESILCVGKTNLKPYFNRDAVREPYTETFLANAAGKVRKATKGRFSSGDKETVYSAHEGGALPRDVIKVPALAGGAGRKERVDHPTQKPLLLCEKLLKACLKPGEIPFVVIPFVGSGSECVACKRLGCSFVGYEINPKYVDLAKQRLSLE